MKIVEIRQQDFATAAALHSHVATQLQFPAYYGANLDALYDCLTDVRRPTFVHVMLNPEALPMESEWFDPFCVTFKDASHDNPMLFFQMDVPRGLFSGTMDPFLGVMAMS